jgi:hypothetical protein
MTKEDVIKFLEDNLIDHGSETGIFHYQREGDSFDWTMIYGGSAGHIGELGRDATLKELEDTDVLINEDEGDWKDFTEFNTNIVIKIIKAMLK